MNEQIQIILGRLIDIIQFHIYDKGQAKQQL